MYGFRLGSKFKKIIYKNLNLPSLRPSALFTKIVNLPYKVL